MNPILVFSACVCLAYVYMISRFIKGWNKISGYPSHNTSLKTEVSVIVAFRNEENNLPALFTALEVQSYQKSLFEILFADDHSDDESVFLVNKFIAAFGNARLIRLGETDSGKKKALAIAATEAKGQLLVFTDADCLPGKDWLKTIVSCYEDKQPVLIAAPVVIQPSPGFIKRFQSLEFLSLIGSTCGAFGIGDPIMINGANLAVQKNIYLESIDFLQNRTFSGDDVFLLLHLKKIYPERLIFLKSLTATVSIKAYSGISDFLQQRMRWTSKSRFYKDKSIIITAVIVLFINLWLLNCFVMSFFRGNYLFIWAGIFMVKSIIDYIFMRKVLRFFKEERLLRIFILSQILYFFYISFTGIAGNLMPSRWKGRNVK